MLYSGHAGNSRGRCYPVPDPERGSVRSGRRRPPSHQAHRHPGSVTCRVMGGGETVVIDVVFVCRVVLV